MSDLLLQTHWFSYAPSLTYPTEDACPWQMKVLNFGNSGSSKKVSCHPGGDEQSHPGLDPPPWCSQRSFGPKLEPLATYKERTHEPLGFLMTSFWKSVCVCMYIYICMFLFIYLSICLFFYRHIIRMLGYPSQEIWN